jgi:LmbE family N-acetylglucosaminyl deacetylase
MERLIIAPHADDESLGCGGLIASDPCSVHVVVLSDKGDGRMDEFDIARKTLGFETFTPPTHRTGELAANARELVGALDRIIRQMRPKTLLLPAPGTHQDHIATYEAGLRAARLSYTDGSWYVPEVVLYDVPGYATDLYTMPYRWNRFVPLTELSMEAKVDAVRAYDSQSRGHFDPAEMVKAQAVLLGHRIGKPYAEQYAVVREIQDI